MHTHTDGHYQILCKVICARAICVAFLNFFLKIFSRNIERFCGQNVANSWKVWKRPHRKTVWKVSTGSSSWAITAKRKWTFASSSSFLLWTGLPGGVMPCLKWLTQEQAHISNCKCKRTYIFCCSCHAMNLVLPFLLLGKDDKSFVQLFEGKKARCFRITGYF